MNHPSTDTTWDYYDPSQAIHMRQMSQSEAYDYPVFYTSITALDTVAKDTETPFLEPLRISQRVRILLQKLQMNKTSFAKIFNVSRPSLDAWLNSSASPNRKYIEKIEWLETFIASLNDAILLKISLYMSRTLGPKHSSLKELLTSSSIEAPLVAKFLNDSVIRSANRPVFGSWKKEKNMGYIPEIPEAYSDNG